MAAVPATARYSNSTWTAAATRCSRASAPRARRVLSACRLGASSDGALYGTTAGGGSARAARCSNSTRTAPATRSQELQQLGGDGGEPHAALVQASDGALCGTTWGGGYGTCLSSSWTQRLYGAQELQQLGRRCVLSVCGLVQASDDALYGTTESGGSAGYGTVFKLNPDGSGYTVLKSFSSSGGDGYHPYAALVQASDGALYGTTYQGGSSGRARCSNSTGTGALHGAQELQQLGGDGYYLYAA